MTLTLGRNEVPDVAVRQQRSLQQQQPSQQKGLAECQVLGGTGLVFRLSEVLPFY